MRFATARAGEGCSRIAQAIIAAIATATPAVMPASVSEFTANGRKRCGSSGSPEVAASQASAPAGMAKPNATGMAQATCAPACFQPCSITGRSGGWRVVVG